MPQTAIVETIFKNGKDAHDKGVLRCFSPYPPGSRRSAEWLQGWDAALKAAHGQREKLAEKADTVAAEPVALVAEDDGDARILGDEPKLR